MTVDINALGPNVHRDYKRFYREGLDPQAMRTLIEALAPLLPEYSVFKPADEDEWEFYGASASDVPP